MKHYKESDLIPDTPFGYAAIDYVNGDVFDIAWVRLPIWGFYFDIRRCGYRWGQRVLGWHGKDGFTIFTRFP